MLNVEGRPDQPHPTFNIQHFVLPSDPATRRPGDPPTRQPVPGTWYDDIPLQQAPPMIRFEDILDRVESYKPDFDEELLQKAYIFSAREHRGQVRSSGEPYLIHPLNVAY